MKFDDLIIRCSQLGKVMTDAKSKDEFDLSVGARTYVKELVKMQVFGYSKDFASKYTAKGNECEDDSIELLNTVFFKNYTKHFGRVTDGFLTGECDIQTEETIIDVKSSWSADTFPATPEEGNNSDYEWQLRGYMKIYDKPFACLAYCLVDTPDDLIGYEDTSAHYVSHIEPFLRVTCLHFQRNKELEQKIEHKVNECRKYANHYFYQIKNKNL